MFSDANLLFCRILKIFTNTFNIHKAKPIIPFSYNTLGNNFRKPRSVPIYLLVLEFIVLPIYHYSFVAFSDLCTTYTCYLLPGFFFPLSHFLLIFYSDVIVIYKLW